MPKTSKKLHKISEEVLVKANIALKVQISELNEVPDLKNIKSLKEKILKQISSCFIDDLALDGVAYSIEILETNSRSIRKFEDTVKDKD